MGPLACLPSRTPSTVRIVERHVNRPPFAVMSYVFHLPAALMTGRRFRDADDGAGGIARIRALVVDVHLVRVLRGDFLRIGAA